MDTTATLKRQNGQWVIRIPTETWVIDDILHDVAHSPRAVLVEVMLTDEPPASAGGATCWVGSGQLAENDFSIIRAGVLFLVAGEGDTKTKS